MISRRQGFLLRGFAVFAFLSASAASAAEFFVSISGNDSQDGRSEQRAWRTIQKANEVLEAGDMVIIGAGTYNEAIEPRNSGTGANARITYRAAVAGTAIVTGGFNLSGRDFLTISGIDIDAKGYYARLDNTRHVTIENSVMWGVQQNPGISMSSASYAILRNNQINGTNERYLDLIRVHGNAHHNLLQDNYLEQASHTLIQITGSSNFDDSDPRFNIFRGNIYVSDFHHCVTVVYGAHSNVFERESYLRCGSGKETPKLEFKHYSGGAQGEAWHAWQPNGIYRFNLVMRSGSYGDEEHIASFGGVSSRQDSGRIQRTLANRIYHNTFVDNYGVVVRLGAWCQDGTCAGVEYGHNEFKNNLFHNNGGSQSVFGKVVARYTFFGGAPVSEGDLWSGNLVSGNANDVVMWNGEPYTWDEAADNVLASQVHFSRNHFGDPMFTDAQNLDFSLRNGSDAEDAGVVLTRTTSAGSGRSVSVEDARYFIDGFGIVKGDTIRIGEEIVTVVGTNYSKNIIDVDRSISWSPSAAVSFPYDGTAPDIGARESALSQRRPRPPVLTLTAAP